MLRYTPSTNLERFLMPRRRISKAGNERHDGSPMKKLCSIEIKNWLHQTDLTCSNSCKIVARDNNLGFGGQDSNFLAVVEMKNQFMEMKNKLCY
ncbi:hypothetical protein AAHA92_27438 [Salvia divinorum]|uniref:Uncharacterized protein n=1 Tax=Salvia divinorum TaxID=28513 RepID=A0ABD1G4R4_SALDI